MLGERCLLPPLALPLGKPGRHRAAGCRDALTGCHLAVHSTFAIFIPTFPKSWLHFQWTEMLGVRAA